MGPVESQATGNGCNVGLPRQLGGYGGVQDEEGHLLLVSHSSMHDLSYEIPEAQSITGSAIRFCDKKFDASITSEGPRAPLEPAEGVISLQRCGPLEPTGQLVQFYPPGSFRTCHTANLDESHTSLRTVTQST